MSQGFVPPSPARLPLSIKVIEVLAFFNMDQEVILLFTCESLTNICIELLFLGAQGVLLTIPSLAHSFCN